MGYLQFTRYIYKCCTPGPRNKLTKSGLQTMQCGSLVSNGNDSKILDFANLTRSIRLINGLGTEVLFAAANRVPNHPVHCMFVSAHCSLNCLGHVSYFY